ncbi:MAG: hypothetical protein AAB438_02910 [Patescibacteria group bacterium]
MKKKEEIINELAAEYAKMILVKLNTPTYFPISGLRIVDDFAKKYDIMITRYMVPIPWKWGDTEVLTVFIGAGIFSFHRNVLMYKAKVLCKRQWKLNSTEYTKK